jgi:hypothetical protein
MREYMQAYRDRRDPTRVWPPRIERLFLGPRKTWKRGGTMSLPPRGLLASEAVSELLSLSSVGYQDACFCKSSRTSDR